MTTSMVDWTVALNTATRLVKPGPEISREGAAAVVAELRGYANRAERYVRDVTGLQAGSGTAPVLVVDRPRWIQANLDGFRQILLPLNAKVIDRMKQSNPDHGEPWASDYRGRGGRVAQLSVVEGPWPVRSVLPGRRSHLSWRPTAARRAEHRCHRA